MTHTWKSVVTTVVVIDFPVIECGCSEYLDVTSSDEYSHVTSRSSREGDQVHFHVSVRDLVPWFVYEFEINWTLGSYKLANTWKSVVKATDTDYYTLRESLLRRRDDFHFGIMTWDTYKKGNDPFVIEVTVRDMHPGMTSEESLIGNRNIDSSVSTVHLKYEEKKNLAERTYYKLHSFPWSRTRKEEDVLIIQSLMRTMKNRHQSHTSRTRSLVILSFSCQKVGCPCGGDR